MKERLLLINYTTSKEFFSYIYKHELQVLNSYKNLHVRIAKNFPNHMKNIELKRTWKQREKKKRKRKKGSSCIIFLFYIFTHVFEKNFSKTRSDWTDPTFPLLTSSNLRHLPRHSSFCGPQNSPLRAPPTHPWNP